MPWKVRDCGEEAADMGGGASSRLSGEEGERNQTDTRRKEHCHPEDESAGTVACPDHKHHEDSKKRTLTDSEGYTDRDYRGRDGTTHIPSGKEGRQEECSKIDGIGE